MDVGYQLNEIVRYTGSQELEYTTINDIQGGHMAKQVTHWTREQKQQAAIQYAIQGSLAKIERDMGIPDATVSTWKKEEWWVELVGALRNEKSEEHRAQYVRIVGKAQKRVLKALPKATAQQAMIIAGVGTDKVRLHDGMPTSISGKAESMSSLANEFRALSAKWEEKQSRVVSTQNDTQVIDK